MTKSFISLMDEADRYAHNKNKDITLYICDNIETIQETILIVKGNTRIRIFIEPHDLFDAKSLLNLGRRIKSGIDLLAAAHTQPIRR